MPGKIPRLRISEYTYELPEGNIASVPAEPRDASRLLCFNKGVIEHRRFAELSDIIGSDTFLVFNDTRVIPARLIFHTDSGAAIEIFLLKPLDPEWMYWEVLVGNRRKFREDIILIGGVQQSAKGTGHLEVSWSDRDSNKVQLQAVGDLDVRELIGLQGNIPLPPYIKRAPREEDKLRYQTVFARNAGAVAAPTASLHFTDEVLKSLNDAGVTSAYLTLHVGLGTFKPVTSEFSDEHDMHSESFVITSPFMELLIANRHKRIIPAGTTSLRLLESLYYIGAAKILGRANPEYVSSESGYDPELNGIKLEDALAAVKDMVNENGGQLAGETAIYIMPGFKFRLAGGLITNFHQPGSTLLMLVAAFVGPGWKEIYRSALAEGYRFLSYGDASLLIP